MSPIVTNPRRLGLAGVLLRGLVALVVWLGLVGSAAGVATYCRFAQDVDVALVQSFQEPAGPGVTRFLASDGDLVGEWYEERRLAVRWEQLPRHVVLAFLAAEDARFFAHDGIDPRGIARAVLTNLSSDGAAVGGSTITQQVAKMAVGSRKSYARKAREGILARRLEDVLTKQQILTLYLNRIFLGHHSYGVQAAAQNYFHKNVWDLTLAEAAMLAGLPQAPSRVNPVADMAAARRRMGYVLDQMERWGWATAEQTAAARAEPLEVHPRADVLGDKVPYYTELARQQIEARYGREDDESAWLKHGLTVQLAVSPPMQAAAQLAVRSGLERLAKRQGYPGPLAREVPREAFLRANERWIGPKPPEPGARLLGRVAAVTAQAATVELGAAVQGTFRLETTRWAGPYTELPEGKHTRRTKVSFEPKLRSLERAFEPGDVVLVEVGEGPPAALSLVLVPIPIMEAALLTFPVNDGGLEAAVGGWDFDRSQVNRVTSVRQTGSAIKPIVYGKAYDLGLPPSALFSGAPFREGKYNPTGRKAKDDMMVWDALVRSDNAVSLRVLQYVLGKTSLEDYEAWGRKLGLTQPLKGHTAEVLGGDQTPLGMAHAFGVFANRGVDPRPYLIRKVVDASGRVLERHVHPGAVWADISDTILRTYDLNAAAQTQVIPETTAWLVTANLTEAVERGTAKRASKLAHDVAGKTGTLPYDVWFAGFTSLRVAVAWLGADRRERPLGESERLGKVYGADTALPMWMDFMRGVDVDRPSVRLTAAKPDDVVKLRIDPANGLLAPGSDRVVPHRKGTEPTELSPGTVSPTDAGALETEF